MSRTLATLLTVAFACAPPPTVEQPLQNSVSLDHPNIFPDDDSIHPIVAIRSAIACYEINSDVTQSVPVKPRDPSISRIYATRLPKGKMSLYISKSIQPKGKRSTIRIHDKPPYGSIDFYSEYGDKNVAYRREDGGEPTSQMKGTYRKFATIYIIELTQSSWRCK